MVTITPSSNRGNYAASKTALFSCPIYWKVTGTTDGFIVQHVQRNEKYNAVAKGRGKGEVEVVSAHDYWEAWKIELDAAGHPYATPRDDNGINDNFAVNVEENKIAVNGGFQTFASKDETRGRWKIRGTVYYVPNAEFGAQLGAGWHHYFDPNSGARLNQPGSVREAGKLLSRYAKPCAGNGLALRASLGNPVYTREFAGDWDLTVPGKPQSNFRPFPRANFDTKPQNWNTRS